MFGASAFLRPTHQKANELGFDSACLGLDKINPFPVGSVEHKQWEWGWNEGIEMLNEYEEAAYYPSDEYGCERD